MTSSREEEEFVAVRVQDPRVQNEGSWNSYVDFKIFLHTNSKAFTAKTSCVRRRYSEFVWLRKKMQKNAGLVPVPDLPGKSFFSFSNEDFLERRRTGLQAFLDKVVHTTVCLSDSQLHLFLQTQLPIGHIQDCVQGHTPYSVTDAILTYASSNRGLAQAQEDDAVKDSTLTVSYESMESPALHPPCPQTNEAFSPELLSCGDLDPLEGLLDFRDQDLADLQQTVKSSIRISQRSNHLEAVVEGGGLTAARFYLGESLDHKKDLSLEEQVQHGRSRIQTPVVVHSPMRGGKEDSVFESEGASGSTGRPSAQVAPQEGAGPEGSDGSKETLRDGETESHESAAEDVGDQCLQPLQRRGPGGQRVETQEEPLQAALTLLDGDEDALDDLMGTEDESEEDSQSLPSSGGSIVKVSDEEEEGSACEEVDLTIRAVNGFVKLPPEDVHHWSAASGGDVNLQLNRRSVEKQDEDVNWAAGDGDLTENSDISILESSGAAGLTDGLETEASPDAGGDTQDAQVL